MNDAIQVQVIEARNLKSADLFSKSDPYAELTILGQRHSGKAERTKTIWNNNSPVWNEAFTLYPQSMNDSLRIQLFDKDVGTKDDYLGEVIIPLNRYYNKGMVDDWLPVMGKGGRSHLFGREKGEIHIKVTYGKGPNVAPTMPAPLPYQQPMAPSNPQGGAKPTQYMGPANPAAAAALGQPPVKSNQQPPPYPGIGKAPVSAPPASMAPSAPAMAPPAMPPAASAPLYPPIQPSTASASYPPPQQQYPPSTPWGSVPPPQQYAMPPAMNPSMGQYPPTQPPMQSFGPIPPQMQQYPPMNQGYQQNPIPPTGFNPIPPFM